MTDEQHPRAQPVTGQEPEADDLHTWLRCYLAYLRMHNYTAQSCWHHERYLLDFLGWCDTRGLISPAQIDRTVLETYLLFLHNYRTRKGAPLKWLSKQNKLTPVRSFFRWLARERPLPVDPAAELSQGRQPLRLQAHTLKENEVAQLMAQPDTGSPLGIRDRAMLETLFSTGIRRMELSALQLTDVDANRGTLFVHQGKGRKDRLIPIGPSALHWIGLYLQQVRPRYAAAGQNGLFLTEKGEPFNLAWLGSVIGAYVKQAFPQRGGACHLLRHSMATQMLEDGADIRYVQAMLGHAQLTSTQIYTRVSISSLQAVHARTAPGAGTPRAIRPPLKAANKRALKAAFHQQAHALIDQLPVDAGWMDLIQLAAAAAQTKGGG